MQQCEPCATNLMPYSSLLRVRYPNYRCTQIHVFCIVPTPTPTAPIKRTIEKEKGGKSIQSATGINFFCISPIVQKPQETADK